MGSIYNLNRGPDFLPVPLKEYIIYQLTPNAMLPQLKYETTIQQGRHILETANGQLCLNGDMN